MPAHPALQELWQETGRTRPASASNAHEYSPLLMGEVDVSAVAESLNRLYCDPEHFAKVAQAGLARTRLPNSIGPSRPTFW